MTAVKAAQANGTFSGSFARGGRVAKTGVALVHAGEHVLTKAQYTKLKRAATRGSK